MPKDLFPGRDQPISPQIYAYTTSQYQGLYKVGYTTRADIEERVKEQFGVIQPGSGNPYKIEFTESAMRNDGSVFTDHRVHFPVLLIKLFYSKLALKKVSYRPSVVKTSKFGLLNNIQVSERVPILNFALLLFYRIYIISNFVELVFLHYSVYYKHRKYIGETK